MRSRLKEEWVLLRPLRLPEGHANSEETPDIYSECFDPEAQRGARFEASWIQFSQSLADDADECFRLCVERGSRSIFGSLWVYESCFASCSVAAVDPSKLSAILLVVNVRSWLEAFLLS